MRGGTNALYDLQLRQSCNHAVPRRVLRRTLASGALAHVLVHGCALPTGAISLTNPLRVLIVCQRFTKLVSTCACIFYVLVQISILGLGRSRHQNHKVPPHLKHERIGGQNGGVVATPNGELVATFGVHIISWAPTMDIDTSTT